MSRALTLVYGVVAYLGFLTIFLALAGFTADLGPLRGIDDAPTGSIAIDLALIALFGVSHSVLARAPVKAHLPPAIERSTYVLVADLTLGLVAWQWRAQPEVVWTLPRAVWAIHVAALALITYATFLTDHFDLFGLRQVWLFARGRAYTPVPFVERGAYRLVRHPMMLGFVVWLWSTPRMTVGHLVFALAMSAYVAIGVHFEERDLARNLGAPYQDYRRRVGAIVPRPSRRG